MIKSNNDMKKSQSKPISGTLKYQRLGRIYPSNQGKRKINKNVMIRESSKPKSILMSFNKRLSLK